MLEQSVMGKLKLPTETSQLCSHLDEPDDTQMLGHFLLHRNEIANKS